MSEILLVGPGKSNLRYGLEHKEINSFDKDEHLTVLDYDKDIIEFWEERGAAGYLVNLSCQGIPVVPNNTFDEVQAHQVLNLLDGPPSTFYFVWRELWRVMKPGGLLFASVPHWKSRYIYAYPGPQRVYTPEVIAYLDHNADMNAKEAFSTLWPKPYNFKKVEAYEVFHQDDHTSPLGYMFTLEKNHV